MRILCVSAQMPGHLDWGGYLATAQELQRRGHQVLWVSGEAVRPQLQQAGIPQHVVAETGWRWPPPPPLQRRAGMDPAALARLRAERGLDQWLDPGRVIPAVTELQAVAETFAPDLIVSEAFVSAAALVAEALDLPFVVAGWPAMEWQVSAASQPVVTLARQRLQTLCNHFGLAGTHWTPAGPPALLSTRLHITYWSASWYGELPVLPQTHHVGGKAKAEAGLAAWSEGERSEKPLVLITLGTSFANDENFFIAAARSVAQSGAQPLVVLGGFAPRQGLEEFQRHLPAESIVRDHVGFDGVLPQIAAAIHHGGAGTTHALVLHGVPQILVPHAADQMHQAQGITRSGAGLTIRPRDVTVERLAQTVHDLLSRESAVRQRAQALRTEFAQLGGVAAAADLLEQVR